ncbi:MAG: cation transporter, partial [Oscillospiraceae bacterium]
IDNSRQEYIDIETKEKDSMVILKIEGMMCGHCVKHVQAALEGIEGVTATVDLEKNQATVTSKTAIDTDLLVAAVKNAGYEVTQVITE